MALLFISSPPRSGARSPFERHPPWKTLHSNFFIVETSVTDANGPNQDYTQPDGHIHCSLICNLLMFFKRGRQSSLIPFTVEPG